MIAPMARINAGCRLTEADRMLASLRDLGVIHLTPTEPAKAVPEQRTATAMEQLSRALEILKTVQPADARVDKGALEAAAEVVRIQRESTERRARLAALHRQEEQIALWGDVRLEQLAELRQAGIGPRFFAVPDRLLGEMSGELVCVLHPLPGHRALVAVIERGGEVTPPDGAEPLPPPSRDRPSLRAEVAAIDASQREDDELLGRLACLVPDLEAELAEQRRQAAYTVALRGAVATDRLFAVQGWVPRDRVDAVTRGLARAGVEAAVATRPPTEDEQPPTLFRPVWWARPIEGLFDILGTLPGYREFDISAAFMIALPIFAAILISDAGYGLIYLLLPIVFSRKLRGGSRPQLARLIMVIGALSVVWGLLTASFFGFDIHRVLAAVPVLGRLFADGPPIVVSMTHPGIGVGSPMALLMRISFTLGAIHLSAAHLWRARDSFPHLRFLGELGWAGWFWGMYGLVDAFVIGTPFLGTGYPDLLVASGAMAIVFAAPDRNPLKMVGAGVASFPLSAIGSFGDTVSYVRLMAIGLASTALAVAFDNMAVGQPWLAAILLLLLGHSLNVALTIVALFAHGVRLNMLEFSNNLGMQWTGYPYQPFADQRVQES